jgi:hypothetical protein
MTIDALSIDHQMPEYVFDADGAVRLQRPTSYFTNAQKAAQQLASQGVVGYKVRNRFGATWDIPFIIYERMKSLFEDGTLTIVDRVKKYGPRQFEQGMSGIDTEMSNAIHGHF